MLNYNQSTALLLFIMFIAAVFLIVGMITVLRFMFVHDRKRPERAIKQVAQEHVIDVECRVMAEPDDIGVVENINILKSAEKLKSVDWSIFDQPTCVRKGCLPGY